MRALLLILVGLAACGPSPTPVDAGLDHGPVLDAACSEGGASVVVGGGNGPSVTGFRPLSNGDTVYLTPGPQGGQHIWIGLRGRGFDGTQPLIHLRAYRVPDGELIGQLRIRLRLSPSPEDPSALALAAQTLIIDDDRYCTVLDGQVRVTLDLSDGAGRCLHDERTLRIGGIDPTALEIDRTARLNCCTQFLRRCYPMGPPPDAAVDAAVDATD